MTHKLIVYIDFCHYHLHPKSNSKNNKKVSNQLVFPKVYELNSIDTDSSFNFS